MTEDYEFEEFFDESAEESTISEQSDEFIGPEELVEGEESFLEDVSEESGGFFDEFMQSLWNTEPSTPLDECESLFDPERGGMKRISRGFIKILDSGGHPAWLDVCVGIAEVYVDSTLGESEEDDLVETI